MTRLLRVLLLPGLGVLALWLSVAPSARSDDPKAKIDPAKDVVVKHVTLQESGISVSKALQKVREQTGIEVARQADDDPKINLKLDKVTFWQAVDAIAKAGDMRVSLYQRDGKMALIQGPYREVPTSNSGPFRVVLKRLMTIRDLESDAHACVARLEVAWQPPFQAFLIEVKPDSLVLQDDKGLAQDMPRVGKAPAFVDSTRHAMEIDVPLPALRRSVPRIGLFKGSLNMVGSGKQLAFTFEELKKGKKQTIDGVAMDMTDFEAKKGEDNEALWTVKLTLQYPESTFKLESFQMSAWLVRNKAFLVSKKGTKFEVNGGYDSDDVSANKSVISYRFVEDKEKGFEPKSPADWKFEYLTPGAVIEVPVPFEFKDVPLP